MSDIDTLTERARLLKKQSDDLASESESCFKKANALKLQQQIDAVRKSLSETMLDIDTYQSRYSEVYAITIPFHWNKEIQYDKDLKPYEALNTDLVKFKCLSEISEDYRGYGYVADDLESLVAFAKAFPMSLNWYCLTLTRDELQKKIDILNAVLT